MFQLFMIYVLALTLNTVSVLCFALFCFVLAPYVDWLALHCVKVRFGTAGHREGKFHP